MIGADRHRVGQHIREAQVRTFKVVGKLWSTMEERNARLEVVLSPPLQINLLSQKEVALYEELRAGDSLLDPEAKEGGILCIHHIIFWEAQRDSLMQKLKSLGIEEAAR